MLSEGLLSEEELEELLSPEAVMRLGSPGRVQAASRPPASARAPARELRAAPSAQATTW